MVSVIVVDTAREMHTATEAAHDGGAAQGRRAAHACRAMAASSESSSLIRLARSGAALWTSATWLSSKPRAQSHNRTNAALPKERHCRRSELPSVPDPATLARPSGASLLQAHLAEAQAEAAYPEGLRAASSATLRARPRTAARCVSVRPSSVSQWWKAKGVVSASGRGSAIHSSSFSAAASCSRTHSFFFLPPSWLGAPRHSLRSAASCGSDSTSSHTFPTCSSLHPCASSASHSRSGGIPSEGCGSGAESRAKTSFPNLAHVASSSSSAAACCPAASRSLVSRSRCCEASIARASRSELAHRAREVPGSAVLGAGAAARAYASDHTLPPLDVYTRRTRLSFSRRPQNITHPTAQRPPPGLAPLPSAAALACAMARRTRVTSTRGCASWRYSTLPGRALPSRAATEPAGPLKRQPTPAAAAAAAVAAAAAAGEGAGAAVRCDAPCVRGARRSHSAPRSMRRRAPRACAPPRASRPKPRHSCRPKPPRCCRPRAAPKAAPKAASEAASEAAPEAASEAASAAASEA
eukprot:scaffold48616_cov69-Phaeocystis_antarctica.AAC.3